jgi:hypothetical protein
MCEIAQFMALTYKELPQSVIVPGGGAAAQRGQQEILDVEVEGGKHIVPVADHTKPTAQLAEFIIRLYALQILVWC